MICNCICGCKKEAGGYAGSPDLCIECALNYALGAGKYHGPPYVPTVWPKLEPEVVISKERADAAIDKAMEGLI